MQRKPKSVPYGLGWETSQPNLRLLWLDRRRALSFFNLHMSGFWHNYHAVTKNLKIAFNFLR